MATTFTEARSLILDNISPLGSERVDLLQAAGRILAEKIDASGDLPAWDNTAMDGFAVRAKDCAALPHLTVIAHLPAGASATGIFVSPGTAVRIMTGAPCPDGCDAIVPIEETEEDGDKIHILRPVISGQHIRCRGEDIMAGSELLPAGTLLRPAEICLLASLGQVSVVVTRRPQVAILSTGDELVEVGEAAGPGQIINSNAVALAAAVEEAGGVPLLLGIARDNRESHREKLIAGLQADVLITSAGVSAGDRDLVREVLAELGAEQIFWKVDIKPGRPTAFSRRGKTPIFSLPGNPVSALITFEAFVRPALLKMQGQSEIERPTIKAALQEETTKKAGRLQFLRVEVKKSGDGLVAGSAGNQETGILRTMVRANGIALLPADRDLFAAGEEVEVILLGPPVTV